MDLCVNAKVVPAVDQVILRWHVQRGVAAIPKSVHKERIEENINVFDFQLSDEDMAATALRTISFSIPVTGVTIILGAVLQSLNNSGKEFAISMERIVVLLASAWLLSLTGRLEMVWWAFPLTEVVALVMGLVFWRKVNAQYIKPLLKMD